MADKFLLDNLHLACMHDIKVINNIETAEGVSLDKVRARLQAAVQVVNALLDILEQNEQLDEDMVDILSGIHDYIINLELLLITHYVTYYND